MDQDLIAELYRKMRSIRRFEEETERLVHEGRIAGPIPTCKGQEAIAVGAASVIEAADYVVSGARCHGHFIARGGALGAAFAELYRQESGCAAGRGGSLQFHDTARRVFGGWSPEAALLAAGAAMGEQLQQSSAIALCFLSAPAVQNGQLHEAAMLISLWKLPIVLIIEHAHDEVEDELDERDLSISAFSYGFARDTVDGHDLFAVRAAVHSAATQARESRVATIIEAHTSWLRRAEAAQEPRPWSVRDPIESLSAKLDSLNMRKTREKIEMEVEQEIKEMKHSGSLEQAGKDA